MSVVPLYHNPSIADRLSEFPTETARGQQERLQQILPLPGASPTRRGDRPTGTILPEMRPASRFKGENDPRNERIQCIRIAVPAPATAERDRREPALSPPGPVAGRIDLRPSRHLVRLVVRAFHGIHLQPGDVSGCIAGE